MKRIIRISSIVALCCIGYNFYWENDKLKQANFEFVGKFDYRIVDEDMFNQTFLSESSLGFLIGDLHIQGIFIKNIEYLDSTQDYIVSYKHPIQFVYTNSEYVRSEGQEHIKKKPIEIIQDRLIAENYVFVYLLKPAGKYRLLLP